MFSSLSKHVPKISLSHSAYVATLIKSDGVKIDGFLYPKFYVDSKDLREKFLPLSSLRSFFSDFFPLVGFEKKIVFSRRDGG